MKTLIKQTFSGDVISSGGVKRLGGINIFDHWEIVDVDGDTLSKQTRRDATADELALILSPEVANLTSANAVLTQQNVVLQSEITALQARLDAAREALSAVASADASWDTNVRNKVSAVLSNP